MEKTNKEIKNMTNEQRNAYVNDLIALGEKEKLFGIVLKLFRSKYLLNDKYLLDDLEQDLYIKFDQMLSTYNSTTPFISYIHYAFKTVYADLKKYTNVVKVPDGDQEHNIEFSTEHLNDYYTNEYDLVIDQEQLKYKLDILLTKLKKQSWIIILKLKYKLIDIGLEPSDEQIASYLFEKKYTPTLLSKQRIKQIRDQAIKKLVLEAKILKS